MFKNVASQIIGVQMVTAADGSAFTGTVTCQITKDGGTQGASGGTVTHEGNGFHTLACSQADTNGDHIGYTFIGTGAIPVTVQVYTQDKLAADALNASAKTIGFGVVGNGSSPTSVVCSSINFAGVTTVTANALAGRRFYPLGNTPATAAIVGNGARITANTSGSTPTLTLDANDTLTGTPANTDTFAIL
jgi:hypothetical protein